MGWEDGAKAIELAVVVPTFNERDNIAPLLSSPDAALGGIDYEVVFVVDDSPDETAEVARRIARRDRRVRVLQRIGRRGLASAWIEGGARTNVADFRTQQMPRGDVRTAPLALDWLSGEAFIENNGDDWVRSFSFCFADVALAVAASRDGNGTPHAGLIVA